ncbi:hemolysin family protein [Planococcus lenghuensis]|uniref:Transporter associated domain protein n=1 Tax=Planococcus lenghuensis TaxID=2213202 RepID=A0A1Q2KZC7_9BACL|nr:hemolysin family protein [Planococcus lenghuensis]AQQ53555.1 transporter associated domain protein [Planococcus lenghuensis]
MDSIHLWNILLIILLIAFAAFFVGAEFAVVKVRMSRIEQLASEGNRSALLVQKILADLDYYLSTCQLGITVTALGLGWFGAEMVEDWLAPFLLELNISESFVGILALIAAFALVTFFYVVFGELAPRSIAVQRAEQVTLAIAQPLYAIGKVMKPFVWILAGSAKIVLRAFGVEPAGHGKAHSEEELKIIMTQSYKSGEINQTELSYMQNIFAFDERVAKDIMLPRTQMETLSQDMTHDELLEELREHQYTRYPITEKGDKDDIIGFVNVKEMLTLYTYREDLTACLVVHDLPFVHDNAPIQDVLLAMQQNRVHMAIIIDEYGGTAGMITMEDILEEIVGDIRDEFDEDEVEDIREIDAYRYMLSGRVLLEELEERFGIEFEESEDIDTIGGWMQTYDTEIAEGESVQTETHTFTVQEKDNHTIIQVLMTRHVHPLPEAEENKK